MAGPIVVTAAPNGTRDKPERPPAYPTIRATFDGPLVLSSDYDGETEQAALDRGEADASAFGRTMGTWYTQGPEGYIDHPMAACMVEGLGDGSTGGTEAMADAG